MQGRSSVIEVTSDMYLGMQKVPNAVRSKHDALVLVGAHLKTLYLGVRHLPQSMSGHHIWQSRERVHAMWGGSGRSVGSHA